jgi:hypothetical protein
MARVASMMEAKAGKVDGNLYSIRLEFFSFGATAPILALAFLHETFRFSSVY